MCHQEEEELLLAVDEAQEKLQEQKQQLRGKEKQLEAAKAEVEQKIKSVQGLSRYEAQLHDSLDGTFSKCHRFHRDPLKPRRRVSLAESWRSSSGSR